MVDRRKITYISRALERRFGNPKWEGPSDPLDSLIKTILSQNTNDRNRDRAYSQLRERFPTWEEVLAAKTEKIAEAIRVGGLANQKSARIKAILAWLKREYGQLSLDFIKDMDFDRALETLGPLKGVGVKSLAVVLMFACGQDVFPVDTHVHRVCRRLGLVPMKATAEKTFHLMRDLVPEGRSFSLHLNMIALGRQICRPQDPKCWQCPIARYCSFRSLNPNGYRSRSSARWPGGRQGRSRRGF
ncbi:MAG: endonuclease III domain-containing protein [bacterium]